MVREEDFFEKARQQHTDGESHPSKPWKWNSQLRGGQGNWQTATAYDKAHGKKNNQQDGNSTPKGDDDDKGQQQQKPQQAKTDFSKMSKKELMDWAKKTADVTLVKIASNEDVHTTARQVAYDELSGRGADVSKINTNGLNIPLQAKKAKGTYKKAPKVPIHIPSKVRGRNKAGKQVDYNMADYKKKLEGYTDDQLLKIVGSDGMKSPEMQHLAYEEAASRGVDESKLKIGAPLQKFWDNAEKIANETDDNSAKNVDDEDDFQTYDYGIGDFDLEGFKSKFPEGDMSWEDPDNDVVKKTFDLKTMQGRQMYDKVKYAMRTENPRYVNPDKQLKRMKKGFLQFTAANSNRPLCVCYGGAGVGKTYNLKRVLRDFRQMDEYDPSDPNQGDNYDWVVSPQVNSVAKLAKQLNQHNGKIIIFDDNDDLLTDSEMANLMKTVTDGDPKSRFFPEYDEKGRPTGKNMRFTGKIIVLTNKDSNTLNKSEDAKAVMSRGSKMGINFTVQENLDCLEQRYQTMDTGVKIDGLDEGSDEDKEYRKRIFDFIMDNRDKIDPKTFTVRKFSELYELGAQEMNAKQMASSSKDASDFFGDEDDLEDIWMENLNKANSDNMNSDDLAFNDPAPEEDMSPKERKLLKKLLSDDSDDFTPDDDEDEEEVKKPAKKSKKKNIEKAIDSDWGMTLDEAESLLL